MSVARFARFTLLAVLAAAALPGTAHAAATLTIVGPTALEAPLSSNGTASATVTLYYEAAGFGCPPPGGSVEVALTLGTGSLPAGVTAVVDPATITIPIPAGIYEAPPADNPVVGPFNASATATITYTAATIETNGTGSSSLDAAAAAPTGCQGDAGTATAQAAVQLATLAPPPPPPPVVEEPEKGIPAPSLALAGLAAAGAALLTRRRA